MVKITVTTSTSKALTAKLASAGMDWSVATGSLQAS
jgi:hypothetical protein